MSKIKEISTCRDTGYRKLELDLNESNSLKGIALILLLIHHLFYVQEGRYDDIYIASYGLVNVLGITCKVCVAVFVFLSGYGLGLSIPESGKINIRQFYKRRFVKLFLNYWFIWLLFVPIGIIIFNRTFKYVCGEGGVIYGILDFLGLLYTIGRFGYNPTWWFYSCIILLYLVFPVITYVVFKWPHSIWLLLLGSVAIVKLPLVYIEPIRYYLFPFIIGILVSNKFIISKLPPPVYKFLEPFFVGSVRVSGIIVLLLLLITSCIIRLKIPYALLWDSFIALIIIFLYKSSKQLIKKDMGLKFLGKHSFNIFLFHTFIYYYYFPFLIYWSRNPVIIFISLLLSSIAISLGIEKLKDWMRFYKIQNRITHNG